jgi:RimJ/RimL family protein N-acetyltransferase
MFGLFENSATLVGIMGVQRWEKDESGATAVWWTAFVRPAGYRGHGLAAQLYAEREAWTKARYQRVRILIRESNTRAIAIHEKHGAVHIQTEFIE